MPPYRPLITGNHRCLQKLLKLWHSVPPATAPQLERWHASSETIGASQPASPSPIAVLTADTMGHTQVFASFLRASIETHGETCSGRLAQSWCSLGRAKQGIFGHIPGRTFAKAGGHSNAWRARCAADSLTAALVLCRSLTAARHASRTLACGSGTSHEPATTTCTRSTGT